jgi:hypothetical protein
VAADDLLQQRYTTTRLLSDAVGFWSDVGTGMELALELAKGDYPTVQFTVRITDQAATQTIALPKTMDVNAALTSTDITPVGGALTPKIPAAQVVPSRVDGGDCLKVELKNVDKAKLTPGDYEGQIIDGNQQSVAYITLRATS